MATPLASNDPSDLANAARCFSSCIPPGMHTSLRSLVLSNIGQTATNPVCLTPSAPTALQVLSTTNTTISVGWKQTKNTGSFITGYEVFWGTTNGGPYTSNSGVIPTLPRNYTITGLTTGTTYFVVVVALTAIAGCQSANSNQVSGTTSGQVFNGLLNSLSHYYQLQEAAAPFVDSAPGAFNLTYYNGGADFSRVAGHVQAFASHYPGTGGNNGISSIVGAPFDFSGPGSMSFLCWFNMSNLQTNGFPVIFNNWGSAAGQQSYLFRRDGAGQVGWYGETVAGATVSITPIAAADNAWHMFAGGFDQGNLVWWYQIDNNARVTTPMPTLNSQNATPFGILSWSLGGAQEINGSASDVGIWNKVLSTVDVTGLWNGGAGLPFNQFTV